MARGSGRSVTSGSESYDRRQNRDWQPEPSWCEWHDDLLPSAFQHSKIAARSGAHPSRLCGPRASHLVMRRCGKAAVRHKSRFAVRQGAHYGNALNMKWAIIVHGGAHTIPETKIEPHKTGCLRAVELGAAVLEKGGCALAALEAAIRLLEDDPIFNAGFGSMLNAQGEAEMDAAIMEGEHLGAGAVAAIQGVRHPISVARQLLGSDTVLLSGEGARQFATERGAELCQPEEMIHHEQVAQWRAHKEKRGSDTVGCVALDTQGNFAAGTSTGGLMHKPKGRIGDSPLIGLGLYADNAAGACAMTGDGESIMRLALAHRVIDSMLHGANADQAAEEAIAVMARRVGGQAGCIVLDRQGGVGCAHNADHLAHAYRTAGMPAGVASVTKR